jgi:hypothetical protein
VLMAVYRQSLFPFPTLDGADSAIEEGSDLFPRIEAVVAGRLRHEEGAGAILTNSVRQSTPNRVWQSLSLVASSTPA